MSAAANLADFRNLARKIVCVGRNYKDHALELKNPLPKKPILFLKGNNSLIVEGEKIRIPSGCTELHHEIELAVVIGEFFLVNLNFLGFDWRLFSFCLDGEILGVFRVV